MMAYNMIYIFKFLTPCLRPHIELQTRVFKNTIFVMFAPLLRYYFQWYQQSRFYVTGSIGFPRMYRLESCRRLEYTGLLGERKYSCYIYWVSGKDEYMLTEQSKYKNLIIMSYAWTCEQFWSTPMSLKPIPCYYDRLRWNYNT